MGKAGGKALMAELEKANDKNAQVKKPANKKKAGKK